MLLLALDTSSAAVTAAVHDGSSVLAEHTLLDARAHAEQLAPAVHEVLRRAGAAPSALTRIVVGVGPGPFTSLRVGLVTARVLGHALGVPVCGLCSLDALAEAADAAATGTEFLVATDARRREVYWAAYRREPAAGPAVRIEGPFVTAPADVPVAGRRVVGRGALLYPDALGPALDPAEPSAAVLARRAVRLLAAEGEEGLIGPDPLYLRRPDAALPGERKRVLHGA